MLMNEDIKEPLSLLVLENLNEKDRNALLEINVILNIQINSNSELNMKLIQRRNELIRKAYNNLEKELGAK